MKYLSIVFAAMTVLAAGVLPASASVRNGELCSVQSYDGSIRVGIHTSNDVIASRATRHQIDNAAGWCTDQIAIPGWSGANKNYDDYDGQIDTCYIHFPGDDVIVMIHSNTDRYSVQFATQMCRDVANGNESLIYWY